MGETALTQESGSRPLSGRRILVTRPAAQARHLAEAIEREGGTAVLFPVLAIHDIEDAAPLAAIAARIENFDLAIFISPNAVTRALTAITAHRPWPAKTRVAAMGRTSERELAHFGLTEVIAPAGRFDSEALLELPEMRAVAGWRVVIFRGDGGRELLGETLTARGATVEYLECYRRGKPSLDAAPLLKLWARGELDAITATSSEGLRNLFEMVGSLGQTWLRTTPLLVPHRRIAEEAARLGLVSVTTTGAGDEGLLAGLTAHFAEAENGR